MAMKRQISYYFLLAFILLSQYTFACSCHNGTFSQKEYNDLGVIFYGSVEDQYYDSSLHKNMVKFKVLKQYKGTNQDGFIYAEREANSTCSIDFMIGEHLLLFLPQKWYNYNVNYCTRRLYFKSNYIEPEWLTKMTSKRNGYIKVKNDSNKIEAKGRLKNGLPTGKWYYYNFSRFNYFTKIKAHYQNGYLHGKWEKTTIPYYGINNAYKNKDFENYSFGKLNGLKIEYFNKQVKYSCIYNNGQKNGDSYSYYPNGVISNHTIYKFDKKIECTSYTENGIKEYYQNDSVKFKWYYGNNNLEYEKYTYKYKNSYEKHWWNNGLLKEIITTISQPHEIVMISCFSDYAGNIMVENGNGYYNSKEKSGLYKDSLQTGKWLFLMPNGHYAEAYYQNGIKHGKYTEWNTDSILVLEGYYDLGIKYGKWTDWADNGQKIAERNHANGKTYLINSWKYDGTPMVINGDGIEESVEMDFKNGMSREYILKHIYVNGLLQGQSR